MNALVHAVPHTIDTHVGADALEILTRHWPGLYVQDWEATPFESPSWLAGATRRLPARATPLLLTAATASGRIIAALALARYRERARTHYRPLAAPRLPRLRLTGPHAENEAVAHAFALHLLLRHDDHTDIALPGLRADSALGRAAQTVGQDSLTLDTSPHPVLTLPFPFDALAPSRRRQHTRRCRHWTHLAATHTITYNRSHHQKSLLTGLAVLTRLHRLQPRSPGPGGDLPWRRSVAEIGAAGAFVAHLHVNGTPVAAHLCLTRGSRCYSLDHSVHPGYRHLAPAHALLRHLVEDLARQGFHQLDLGRSTSVTTALGRPMALRLAA